MSRSPITHFRFQEGTLEIKAMSKFWWSCYLVFPGSIRYLGAEGADTFKKRFLPALSENWEDIGGAVAGAIDGREIKYLFALYNVYDSLYMTMDGNDRLLHWQDAYAKFYCTIRLSPGEAAEWSYQLSRKLNTAIPRFSNPW